MDKMVEMGLFNDFYGVLLTEKQREVLEMYYSSDLSLGEISDVLNISRQGVYDILKRSEKILKNYEEKLKLVQKFLIQKDEIKKAYSLLDEISCDDKIDEVKSILIELIDNV
jgi:predicted DNA-binding protein YlxM (UPF0122 family)